MKIENRHETLPEETSLFTMLSAKEQRHCLHATFLFLYVEINILLRGNELNTGLSFLF